MSIVFPFPPALHRTEASAREVKKNKDMEQQKSVELLFWSLSHIHFVHVCRLPLKTIKEQENCFDFLVILLFSLTLPEASNQP